jgi:arabinogalactan oligomer/maltooligosaccharide transport system permease protein
MKPPQSSLRQLAAGLVVGLVVSIGLSSLVLSAARRGSSRTVVAQSAVVTLSAATQLVGTSRDRGVDVQEALVSFVKRDPGIALVRVVDIKGRQLLASTSPADLAAGELPRRLGRDQKEWYDRGQKLRAAVEANQEEGRAWKAELAITALPEGGLSLGAPIEVDGRVTGVLLMETLPVERPGSRGGGLIALVILVVTVAVFVPLGRGLAERGALRVALAALLLLLAMLFFWQHGLNAIADGRRAAETEIAAHLRETTEHARATLASLAVEPSTRLDPTVWNVDLFRQARGTIASDGTVVDTCVDELVGPLRASLGRTFLMTDLLAFLLAAFVGLGGATKSWRALVRHRQAYGFILPAMLGMLLVVFFPFAFGVTLSFTNQTLYNLDKPILEIWTGLSNYLEIITDFDIWTQTETGRALDFHNFYYTLLFTIAWTVTNVAIGVTVGLALALTLNLRGIVLRPIHRVLLILPWAVPNYITALIWRGMFHKQFGVINQIIQIFGGEQVAWFDNPITSFLAVVATNGWLSFPFMMVVSLGALQSIPADLYEAARVDGATKWRQFRSVTLPSLKPALVPAIILSVVWTFNMFNIIYLVSAGEPAGATEILITEAYKIAFEQYRYGYAAAYSTVIFMILLIYGVWQNRVTRATEGI